MVERLVDVLNAQQNVLHTFPVDIRDPATAAKGDAPFKKKAAKSAAFAQLAPKEELPELVTRMHVERGGPVAPYGDDQPIHLETPDSIKQTIEERAYYLWEAEGRPEGRADEHWHRAREEMLRERAYILWEMEGRPEGRAEEHWHQTREHQDPY